MKKKHIVILLLIIGVILLGVSVVLTVISAGNRNIIGGADFPTYCFVFFHEKGGLHSALAFCGIVSIIISVVIGAVKKKK